MQNSEMKYYPSRQQLFLCSKVHNFAVLTKDGEFIARFTNALAACNTAFEYKRQSAYVTGPLEIITAADVHKTVQNWQRSIKSV